MDEPERWLQDSYSSRWTARFRRYCAEKFSRFTDPDQLMEDARQHLLFPYSGRASAAPIPR